MAKVHVISLKLGASHGLWQYKVSGTHERVILHGMSPILNTTCQLLGHDRRDHSVVYLFSFSDGPFETWQVLLERVAETSDGGCHYRAASSNVGELRAKGTLPAFMGSQYFDGWPARIFFRLEPSLTGEIQS